MGIAAWGIAMVYLLVVVVGFTGALLVLVWLFGEAPGESTRTGQEAIEGTDRLELGGMVPASVVTEHSKDEAA